MSEKANTSPASPLPVQVNDCKAAISESDAPLEYRHNPQKWFEQHNADWMVEEGFRNFLMNLLRSLAKGGPFDQPLIDLLDAIRIGGENKVDWITKLETQMELLSQAVLAGERGGYQRDLSRVVADSFRLAAERFALDSAARGRESQRERSLIDGMDIFFEERLTRRKALIRENRRNA